MTSIGNQWASRGTRGVRLLTAMGAVIAVLGTAACSSGGTAEPPGDAAPGASVVLAEGQYLENAAEFVEAADWDTATTVQIELGEMFFKPKDVTLEAGKPYVLELVNTGEVKHEFTAAEFFRSAASRKVESDISEVKVPFFTEIEVLAGKTVEFFVIPVIPGVYEMLCLIPGHREAGMEGTITVTGSAPEVPALVLGSMAAGPWLQNGPDLVEAANWDAAQTVRIEAGEDESGEVGATMFFEPKDLVLKVGMPYVLELVNVGLVKHEWHGADEFFPTMAFRKAEDAAGEYKGPLLKEAEVFAGKQLDVYLIPTKVGTFEIICMLPGHAEAGMVGTITVTE